MGMAAAREGARAVVWGAAKEGAQAAVRAGVKAAARVAARAAAMEVASAVGCDKEMRSLESHCLDHFQAECAPVIHAQQAHRPSHAGAGRGFTHELACMHDGAHLGGGRGGGTGGGLRHSSRAVCYAQQGHSNVTGAHRYRVNMGIRTDHQPAPGLLCQHIPSRRTWGETGAAARWGAPTGSSAAQAAG